MASLMPVARRLPVLLGAALGAALLASPVGAAAAVPDGDAEVTWSVSPADADGADGRTVIDLALDPGDTVTEHLAVRNLSDSEVTFALTAADGYYTDTGRFTMLPAGEPSVDAGAWISVEPSLTVPAGETRVAAFTLTVPDNATPGDHAAGVAASLRTSSSDENGAQVGVDSRVGFRLSVRVSGELAPSLAIDEATAAYSPSPNLFAPGLVSVEYTATNTGNTALALSEVVAGHSGKSGNLLPGESRRVMVERFEAWPLGLLFLDLHVDGAVPGDDLRARPHTDTLVIWAVPWLHLLAAVGIALILLAILTGRRRTKRRFAQLLDEAREEGRRESTEAIRTP